MNNNNNNNNNNIFVIAFILILNLSLMQATCNKTLKLPDPNRQQKQSTLSPSSSSINKYNRMSTLEFVNNQELKRQNEKRLKSRSIKNDDDYYYLNNSSDIRVISHFKNDSTNNNNQSLDLQKQQQQQSLITTTTNIEINNELDLLRLEYYKYRILSQLSMIAEPDELNPQLNFTFRNELLTKVTKNLTNDSGNKNNFRQERPGNGVSNLRHKRSLACNQVKSNKDACCLETFYVNFTDIGWDKWIIYPAGYNANYCRGQCDLSHSRYYHSTLLSKFSNVIGLCCSPKQMSPLRLLYIDENNKVHQKSMPDMIVEGCDCA